MSIALPPGRFSGLVLKVNAFLLIALILVAAFMGLVAYKQGWFVHQSPIHFVTPNALGLNKGMPVKLHGFTVGSVSDLQLAPGGVDVRLLIGSEYLVRIPQDSHAKHAREAGVIGASVIDIVPGKAERALAEGAQIDFEPASGIQSIDAAATQLKKTGEEAQLTLRNARPLLDHSETAAREAGDVLTAAKRIWPLSDSFKESSDGMLPIDSFEAQGKGRSR